MDLVEGQGSASRRCRRLRSKGMFLEIEPSAADPQVPSMSDGFVWCTHTQNCLGPDGRVADAFACMPGRACWER